jgi:hypothetical protein
MDIYQPINYELDKLPTPPDLHPDYFISVNGVLIIMVFVLLIIIIGIALKD